MLGNAAPRGSNIAPMSCLAYAQIMRVTLQAVAILALVSSSCGGADVTACQRFLDHNPESFGRGAAIARFEDFVQTEAEATRAVQEATFRTFAFYSTSPPLMALVGVPNGGECVAIDRLRAHPAIEDAFPQLIVHAQ